MWFEIEKSVFLDAIDRMMMRAFPHEIQTGTFEMITDGDKVFIYSGVDEQGSYCTFKIDFGFDVQMSRNFTIDHFDSNFVLLDELGRSVVVLKPCEYPKSNFWLKNLPEECYGALVLGADGSTFEVVNHGGVPSISISQGTQFLPIEECHGGVRIAFARQYATITMDEF